MKAPRPGAHRFGLRNTDEWVGLLVLLAVIAFAGAVLQAGVLRDWMRTTVTLRVLLPAQGVSGLAVGSEMEVLGTKAGAVRRIVFEPSSRMIAEVDVEEQARPFIRRDSAAVIRRRFGVAGAAYLDVAQGTGAPLDWSFAVIEATSERAPTETVGAMLDEVQRRVFPLLDDLQKAARSLATLLDRVEHGEGSVGRLLADEGLARSVTGVADEATNILRGVSGLLERLDGVAEQANRLVGEAGSGRTGVPALIRRVDQTLANLQQATRDISRTTPRLPQTMRNVEEGTSSLPSLLTQTQQTTRELELLLTQMRGMWLLGGGGTPEPEARRPSSDRLRP